jgi:hypothetical protein
MTTLPLDVYRATLGWRCAPAAHLITPSDGAGNELVMGTADIAVDDAFALRDDCIDTILERGCARRESRSAG